MILKNLFQIDFRPHFFTLCVQKYLQVDTEER